MDFEMKLRTIINSYNTEWWSIMTPTQNVIGKLLHELDQVVIKYECLWGVYRLESLARGELAEKVQAQVEKLADAVSSDDLDAVRDLVAGTIRMYKVLEKNAVQLGHKPIDPVYWEIQVGSKIYRVVKNLVDARALHKPNQECIVMTIEELVRVYDGKHKEFLDTMKKKPEAMKLDDFDFTKGDSTEF